MGAMGQQNERDSTHNRRGTVYRYRRVWVHRYNAHVQREMAPDAEHRSTKKKGFKKSTEQALQPLDGLRNRARMFGF